MKISIVGDSRVGKTMFVKLFVDNFINNYPYNEHVQKCGVDVNLLKFNTIHGEIDVNIWDFCGDEKFNGIRDGNYIGSNYVIIMYDHMNIESYNNIHKWYDNVYRVCGNIPMLIIANNTTFNYKKTKCTMNDGKKLNCVKICNKKSKYHIRLFEHIFRDLFHDDTLTIT